MRDSSVSVANLIELFLADILILIGIGLVNPKACVAPLPSKECFARYELCR